MNSLQVAKRMLAPGLQMPVFVMMYVTHRCNARCGHCFFWRELNRNVQDELTITEIDALAQSIGPVLQVTLTGGSPELREDLPEVARRFVHHCRPANMSICMGGSLPARILSQVEEILRTCPNQRVNISLSIDAWGDEHDRLRGAPGLFKDVVTSFEALAALKSAYPQLHLTCSTCVSGLNYIHVEETIRRVWETLPIDALKLSLVRGRPRNAQALDPACIQSYTRLIHSGEGRNQFRPESSRLPMEILSRAKEMMVRDLINQILLNRRAPIRCGAMRENVVIHSDGTVAGCELRDEKVGNLREVGMDLSRLWVSPIAQEFRKCIRQEECYCHHHGFLSLPYFRSPRAWPRLVHFIWLALKKG